VLFHFILCKEIRKHSLSDFTFIFQLIKKKGEKRKQEKRKRKQEKEEKRKRKQEKRERKQEKRKRKEKKENKYLVLTMLQETI
jgi:hypothetical protein